MTQTTEVRRIPVWSWWWRWRASGCWRRSCRCWPSCGWCFPPPSAPPRRCSSEPGASTGLGDYSYSYTYPRFVEARGAGKNNPTFDVGAVLRVLSHSQVIRLSQLSPQQVSHVLVIDLQVTTFTNVDYERITLHTRRWSLRFRHRRLTLRSPTWLPYGRRLHHGGSYQWSGRRDPRRSSGSVPRHPAARIQIEGESKPRYRKEHFAAVQKKNTIKKIQSTVFLLFEIRHVN